LRIGCHGALARLLCRGRLFPTGCLPIVCSGLASGRRPFVATPAFAAIGFARACRAARGIFAADLRGAGNTRRDGLIQTARDVGCFGFVAGYSIALIRLSVAFAPSRGAVASGIVAVLTRAKTARF